MQMTHACNDSKSPSSTDILNAEDQCATYFYIARSRLCSSEYAEEVPNQVQRKNGAKKLYVACKLEELDCMLLGPLSLEILLLLP